MPPIISVSAVAKTYKTGFIALQAVDLAIDKGRIFALLGPNGAGKTTLISIICGTVTMTSGQVRVGGHDIVQDYRAARAMIGLVPQEMALDIFATVWDTTCFSRGLFGKPRNAAFVERLLRDLSLWEKRDSRVIELSGGMKRRVMIAKALAHEPEILFLDEPTAGVDVALRRDMWGLVRRLRDTGVTVILTTHYIEEAEELADEVGVIDRGRLILVEKTATLMQKLGKRRLTLTLQQPMETIPPELTDWDLTLTDDGQHLVYSFDANAAGTGISGLLRRLSGMGIDFKDLDTSRSSLEDIFISLLEREA
ncbi:MAG: ABC transporter ATP-binding protein [Acidiphilium sp.]|nr:ABC transporter ATP-binding protein [Acidiphilium sp.]MDD4937328.1 ABC transporter ATP-binding protein [Acidiphilium sp.]